MSGYEHSVIDEARLKCHIVGPLERLRTHNETNRWNTQSSGTALAEKPTNQLEIELLGHILLAALFQIQTQTYTVTESFY